MGHRSSPRLCGSSLAGDDSLVLGTFFRVCWESAAVGWRFALPAAVGGGVRGRPCSPSALQHTMCCSLRAPVHLWVQSLQADADMGLTQSKKTCSAFYQHRMRWPRRFPVLRMCEACDADDPRDFDYGCSAVPFFMQNMHVKPKNPLPDLEASCEEGADCAAGCAEGCAEELPAGESSSESSSSSSSEDDSDTEESDTRRSDEEQEKKESQPDRNESGGVNCQPHCEHCRNENAQREQVTPRRLAGGQYLLKLDADGTYQCSVTGLIFEVTEAVTISYSLLSWSKYAGLVKPPWVVGGPLFDVHCKAASTLTSIAFPHSLCLGDGDSHPAFKVLHIKDAGAAIEPSMDYSASHVRWLVSSLSPVGPLIRSEEPLLYHGAVVLYKAVDDDPSLLFRVYVATNNESFIKDIAKAVKHSKKKFIKIDKPPVCQKLLQKGKRYRLLCEPEAEVTPEEIEFVDGSLLKLKSYIEVYLEKQEDFTLSLIELESEAVVWKAKLRESDWIHYDQNKNELKRNAGSIKRRKSTNSFSDEETHCGKKQRSNSTTDGIKTMNLLTDQQLMAIAKLFGAEWKEVAIECLQMEMKDIQQIQAKEQEVNIQKFLLLSKWREREQSNGTAQNLYSRLSEKVSYDIVQLLEGFMAQ